MSAHLAYHTLLFESTYNHGICVISVEEQAGLESARQLIVNPQAHIDIAAEGHFPTHSATEIKYTIYATIFILS